MRVDLLGTGSADRWPNPFCDCPSCAWARASATLRDRTSILIDGHVLIDPGPDLGAHGRDLTGVDTVLVTHAHPDHLDPAFLLARAWADRVSGQARPLLVAGPVQAVDTCLHWLAPDSPTQLRALRAGDVLDAGGLEVRALNASHSTAEGSSPDGTALLYEVSSPRARLLLATDTATLPHEELYGRYDLVLMEQTFGDMLDHGTAHLDLPGFARELGRLRVDGRLAEGARVVAVHLSHHNPIDVGARMATLGAEVLPDGAVLHIGGAGPLGAPERDATPGPVPRTGQLQSDRPTTGRRLLITGGARSGKSRRAEALAIARPDVHYVATSPPRVDDPEWQERIRVHRARRPASWRVSETDDLAAILAAAVPGELVLVDCLTLWLTGVLDDADAWSDPASAAPALRAASDSLLTALRNTRADVVLVTNEVGSGVVPASAAGRLFRDALGTLNSAVAAACDDVEAVLAGIPMTLKGRAWTS